MVRRPTQVLFPRRIRGFAPDDVTRMASDEVSETEVGLSSGSVEQIWRSVVNLYRVGLHPALALCVRVRGKVVLDRTIGHTHGNGPKAPTDEPLTVATPDSLFNIFSASKAVTAMLTLQAWELSLIHI